MSTRLANGLICAIGYYKGSTGKDPDVIRLTTRQLVQLKADPEGRDFLEEQDYGRAWAFDGIRIEIDDRAAGGVG